MVYNITEESEFSVENEYFANDSANGNASRSLDTTSPFSVVHKSQENAFESDIIIPLYVVIFVLSVVGNSLVLATLGQNKRMRTITNVYLLNLAVSDLLLGVFCMPFTLVGQVLRNFIFGATMCKMIPYFQAVSVSVGVWTLVAISLERYFAICRPLKSRRWQTQFHAYKMIACVWLFSLMWTSPILLVSRLKALKMGRHKCREEWPNATSERVFNLFLDIVLLLVPLLIMTMAYSLIVSKLWKGLRHEIRPVRPERCGSTATINGVVLNKSEGLHAGGDGQYDPNSGACSSRGRPARELPARRPTGRRPARMKLWLKKVSLSGREVNSGSLSSSVITLPMLNSSPRYTDEDHSQSGEVTFTETVPCTETKYAFTRHAIRSNYMDKSIEAKKKVIRMLFVVVAEFFMCWAPLHILNTWYLFSPEVIYEYVGATGISLVQLLAYISSCCNPITYCFMNRKFRQSFLNVFTCYKLTCFGKHDGKEALRRSCNLQLANNSEFSGNDSTAYAGRVWSACSTAPVGSPRGDTKDVAFNR